MSSFSSNSLSTTIADGASVSGRVEIGDNALVAIIGDANLTLTFKGSIDGTTFYDICDGTIDPYEVALAANTMVTVDLNQFLAPAYIKIQSGTTDTPTPVSGVVHLQVISKEI